MTLFEDSIERRRGAGGHESAAMEKDEWLTPPWIIDAVGGWQSFTLDPCAPRVRPWPMAREHYTIDDNGLMKPWRGRVWLNPPYGGPKVIGPWMRRMAAHGQGMALIFARTETAIFHRTVWDTAHAVLFLKGRLFFYHHDGRAAGTNAGAPSALVAYGHDDARVLEHCVLEGKFIKLKEY